MSINARKVVLASGLLMVALILPQACKSNKSEMTGYATPNDAANALHTAAKAGDQNALLAIFGPESKDVLYSGDPVQDKNAVTAFVRGQLPLPDSSEEEQRWPVVLRHSGG